MQSILDKSLSSSFIFFAVSFVVIIPILAVVFFYRKIYEIENKILNIFLQLPRKVIKNLSISCEVFLQSFNADLKKEEENGGSGIDEKDTDFLDSMNIQLFKCNIIR